MSYPAVDSATPFSPHVLVAPGVDPELGRRVAASLTWVWSQLPSPDRSALLAFWRRRSKATERPIVSVGGEHCAPSRGLCFDPVLIAAMSARQLAAECALGVARVFLAARNASAWRAEEIAKAWGFAGHVGDHGAYMAKRLGAHAPVVCPEIRCPVHRRRWGLPALPQHVVCPAVTSATQRERWGLPPL